MDRPETNVAPRPTFSLATSLFVIAVICVLLAEYRELGVEVVEIWWFTLLVSVLTFAIWRKLRQVRSISIAVLVISTCAICCLPGRPYYHWGMAASSCGNNLRQIAIAAHNYHDRHTTFPSQHYSDAAGKPGLSWRVSLLPYIEQDVLFRQFDLRQSWDGPVNRAFANIPINVYRCPAELNERGTETSYVAIAGDDTCWPAAGPITFRHIRDGTSKTILFAETHDSGIAWPEPRDLAYDNVDWHVHRSPGNSVASSHGPRIKYFDGSRKLKARTVANVAMADGSIQRLTSDIDPEVLRQMVHRRDGLPKEVP